MEEPEKPRQFWVCPCCLFSFTKVDAYADHLRAMKARVEAALARVGT